VGRAADRQRAEILTEAVVAAIEADEELEKSEGA